MVFLKKSKKSSIYNIELSSVLISYLYVLIYCLLFFGATAVAQLFNRIFHMLNLAIYHFLYCIWGLRL